VNKISFIIRAKNEEKDIERTLKSIRTQDISIPIEIILVDSGSVDQTIEIAKRYVDKVVMIPPEEFTWGLALNKGIEAATGDLIALISGHCVLANSDVLSQSIEFFDVHNIVALYGRQVGEPQKDIFECVETFHSFKDIEYIESCDGMGIIISNAGCLLKREMWEKVPFDEKAQSSEDVLWAKKVCSQGYKVGYTNRFEILHGHPFDTSYIYKKWFWRSYWNRRMEFMNPSKKPKTGIIYIMGSYLIKRPFKMYKYYKEIIQNKLHFKVSQKALITYLYICYLAAFRAIMGEKRNKYDLLDYKDIQVPRYIYWIGKLVQEEMRRNTI
jgi:glycosyltransferase involved in cell wall biosynthesis